MGGPRKVSSFLFNRWLLIFVSQMRILKRILIVWLEVIIHHQLRVEPTTKKPSSFSSGYTLKARGVFVLSTIVTKLEADGAPMRLIAWSFTFSVVECDAKHFCLTWYNEIIYSIKTVFQSSWFVLYFTDLVVPRGGLIFKLRDSDFWISRSILPTCTHFKTNLTTLRF